MTAIRSTRMHITRFIADNRRIGVFMRCAGIIPTRIVAGLPTVIVDCTGGYPVMTAIRSTRMHTTRWRWRWISVLVRRAGVIPSSIGACLVLAIGDCT